MRAGPIEGRSPRRVYTPQSGNKKGRSLRCALGEKSNRLVHHKFVLDAERSEHSIGS
jgi:hypothetical protein